MKNTKKLIMLSMLSLCLSSCNMNVGIGNYSYKKVHIFPHEGVGYCAELNSWHDDTTGVEVHTKDYGDLFLSEGTYMLVEDKCPICDKEK